MIDSTRRRVTDAEPVTLCVAQAIMSIPSDRRFLAVARKRLVHLFPDLPRQAGYFKRRRRLADAIEWLLAHFAQQSPGYSGELLLIDSTPVECGRSRETAKRSALGQDERGRGSPPRPHPPAHRIDLLDLQGPAHAGVSQGAHAGLDRHYAASDHPEAVVTWMVTRAEAVTARVDEVQAGGAEVGLGPVA